jgi:hypothetical protein
MNLRSLWPKYLGTFIQVCVGLCKDYFIGEELLISESKPCIHNLPENREEIKIDLKSLILDFYNT